ncbi:MAG TPA: hypothetical protein PKV93_10485, partial [Fervidobacterium sp.]|nr:hypothetical protein [Fervidobacterium sp.]
SKQVHSSHKGRIVLNVTICTSLLDISDKLDKRWTASTSIQQMSLRILEVQFEIDMNDGKYALDKDFSQRCFQN